MRIRDIIHASGRKLRVGLDRGCGDGVVIQLGDPSASAPPVLLDLYGGGLLAGFLMNARLAVGGSLGEESCGGPLGCRLRLTGEAVELRQHDGRLIVSQLLWGRLYAELMLALAHGRHVLSSGFSFQQDLSSPASRLLH